MQNSTHLPSTEHTEFDHLCERLEEFEPLPEQVADGPQDQPRGLDDREESFLDRQILGGLVTPL